MSKDQLHLEMTIEMKKEGKPFRSTRHANAVPEGVLPEGVPRLGRRESEPHSSEITYLYDVLTTNFPEDRVMWDLNHYFKWAGETVNIQFDLSYFRKFSIPYELSSYKAERYDNRVPDMAINILSKSTYNQDIGMHVERCRSIGVPVYLVINPHLPKPLELKSPFLRVYYRTNTDEPYQVHELRSPCIKEGSTEPVDETKLIDVRADLLPFKFGIMQLNRRYDGNFPRFRLILIDRETNEILPTLAEKERRRAEEERRRAEEERKRAEEERKRAEEEKKRADRAEEQVKRLQEELERLKKQ